MLCAKMYFRTFSMYELRAATTFFVCADDTLTSVMDRRHVRLARAWVMRRLFVQASNSATSSEREDWVRLCSQYM